MLTDGLDSARREVPQLMQVPAATLHLCEHCTVIPFNETPILHTFIFAVLFFSLFLPGFLFDHIRISVTITQILFGLKGRQNTAVFSSACDP